MHEAGLVRAAVAALADAADGRQVRTVVLEIGSGIDLDTTAAAWRAAVTGTCLQDAQVEWRQAFDRLRCFTCGREYDGRPLETCPSCHHTGLVVVPAAGLTALDWTT